MTEHAGEATGAAVKRRGILAAAGAAVAGIVAKQTAGPVLAATVTTDAANTVTTGNTTFQAGATLQPGSAIGAATILTVDGTTGPHAFVKGMLVKSSQEATALTVVGGSGGTVDAALRGSGSGIDVRGGSGAGVSPSVAGSVAITALGGNGAGGGVGTANGAHGIVTTGGNISSNVAAHVAASGGAGISATGGGGTGLSFPGGAGVIAVGGGGGSIGGVGVTATGGANAPGVVGTAGSGTAPGVQGVNATAGGVGVLGQGDAAPGIGVKGTSAGGTGVAGQTTGAGNANAGVLGVGTAGPGVQGQSTAGHGLVGTTFATDGNHTGLIGTVQPGGNAIALRGSVPGGATGFAGVFDGDVIVNGALRVFGSPKNAAVKHPGDGTYRLLYCMESPESWFEDFGEGTLVGGKAAITLDPDFAALVDTSKMHVFPVAHEASGNGLAVTIRHADGFTVQEHAGGTSGGTFSYRVVAKRKDIAGERLAKVAPPPPMKPVAPFAVPETPIPKPPGAKP